MFKFKKAFTPKNVIPNLQIFGRVREENPLLNRIQGDSRIPLQRRGGNEVDGVVSMCEGIK
ncbi:MAG: hypothetical protein R3Y28_04760 [Candidatus Gastranaerophilales bacterium]